MSQDSSKVLKELSMLSTNMDLLVKELKEQNKRTSENTDQIKKLVEEGDKKSTKNQNPKDAQPNEGFFKKLTESFAKQVSDNNKSLTENLTKQIAGDFGGISKNLVKPAEATLNQGNKKDGQIMNALVKSLLSGIPKLETGGSVNNSGVALVGEKGPELVNLTKGNSVLSNDKMAELLQFELEDKKRKEAGQKSALESQVVTGTTNLADSVTNSFGVKVPKSEIEKERKSLLDEGPEYYAMYPEDLQEDLDYFINNYREEITKEEVAKRIASAEALQDKGQPLPKSDVIEEISKKEKKKKEKEAKKADSEKAEALVSPSKPKLLDSLKAKGKEFIGEQKSAFEEKLAQFGLLPKKEKEGQAASLPTTSKLETEKFDLASVSSTNIKDLTAKLKADMQAKKESSPQSSSTESTSSYEKTPAQETPPATSPSTKESKQSEASSAMTQQDLKEIKALLAGIYKSLSGPLNIANDRPFRPNSNVL